MKEYVRYKPKYNYSRVIFNQKNSKIQVLFNRNTVKSLNLNKENIPNF